MPVLMGKILAAKGAGLYSVEILTDTTDSIDIRLALLVSEIVKLNTEHTTQYIVVSDLRIEHTTSIVSMNTSIVIMNGLEGVARKKAAVVVKKYTLEVLKIKNELVHEQRKLNTIEAERVAKSIEHTLLTQRKSGAVNPVFDVWCADLADGLEGRGFYSINDEVELWCVAFDAGNNQEAEYWITPVNSSISLNYFNPLARVPLEKHISVPIAYTSMSAACMTFWNVAMEVGVARWEPALVKGVLAGGGGRDDCGTANGVGHYATLIGHNRWYPPPIDNALAVIDNPSRGAPWHGLDVTVGIAYSPVDENTFKNGDIVLIKVIGDIGEEETEYHVVGFESNPRGAPQNPPAAVPYYGNIQHVRRNSVEAEVNHKLLEASDELVAAPPYFDNSEMFLEELVWLDISRNNDSERVAQHNNRFVGVTSTAKAVSHEGSASSEITCESEAISTPFVISERRWRNYPLGDNVGSPYTEDNGDSIEVWDIKTDIYTTFPYLGELKTYTNLQSRGIAKDTYHYLILTAVYFTDLDTYRLDWAERKRVNKGNKYRDESRRIVEVHGGVGMLCEDSIEPWNIGAWTTISGTGHWGSMKFITIADSPRDERVTESHFDGNEFDGDPPTLLEQHTCFVCQWSLIIPDNPPDPPPWEE